MQSTTSSTRTFITPQANEEKTPSKKKHQPRKLFSRKNLPWLAVIVLLLLCVFLLLEYRQAQNKLNNGSPQYYNSMIKRLGKLIILPTNQTPTIVTVKNAEEVHGQVFYANAKDGDITFVYGKAHEAILYRPSDNIIVNVAPVSLTSNGSSTAK